MNFTGINRREIDKIVDTINKFLHTKENSIDDFQLLKRANGFIVVGSFDFCYYHNIEIIFEDVSYYKGCMDWSRHDDFEVLEIMAEYVDEKHQSESRLKFVFHTDGMEVGKQKGEVEIWASGIGYNTDTVLYYKRDDLKEGQRIAEWVK